MRPYPIMLAIALALAGCTSAGSDGGAGTVEGPAPTPAAPATVQPLQPQLSRYSKVLLVAMENKTEEQVLGTRDAPFLTGLAERFGRPARLDAGYPSRCPSLAAYLLMTSGSDHGVCDDKDPSQHPIAGDNVFAQVAQTGREWRNYAESMPSRCYPTNDGVYAVRHAPAVYYLTERERCASWQVPLGDLDRGALVDDLAAGRLPAFSFVTPNNCHNMHAAPRCPTGAVKQGDRWVSAWMAKVLASPDYTAGRLVVVITWDEGTTQDNHIPAVLVSPTTLGVRSDTPYTQCSVLRTVQEILRVPPLNCAATAPSMLTEFRLG